MTEALTQLLDTLDLEKIDTNIYRGQTPETRIKRNHRHLGREL